MRSYGQAICHRQNRIKGPLGPIRGHRTARWFGYVVREASSGRLLEVRGAGSMKDAKFEIDRKIDLNKPIAKQALTQRPTKKK